ncbi:hypothetical protein [Mesorhizobium metallidurans]|nr:hypothetical protein [Mesorhizobium metallidurans]
MLDRPGVALRLMVAHPITGSGLWQVRREPQRTGNEAVAASLLLGQPEEDGAVAGGNGDAFATPRVFARLLTLSDDDVLRVLAIVMAETVEAGSAVIEALGNHLNVDMAACWQADNALFDLLRDKEIANLILADIGGKRVAHGNVSRR